MAFDSIQPGTSTPFKKAPVNQWLTKWLIGLLILTTLGGGTYLAYNQLVAVQRQEARRKLQTVSVERASLPIAIAANGTIQPKQSTNVSPKSSGRLKKLLVEEGDFVKEGQILAYMDDSNFQGQLLQAKGQLTSAQANLKKVMAGNRPQEIAQARARLREAQANLKRLEAGNRPEDIAKAQAEVRKNEALIAQAQSRLDLAQARVKRLQSPFQEGAVSRDTYDEAVAEERNAKDNLEQTKASLAVAKQDFAKQNNGYQAEEVDQARAQVEEAQQALALSQAGSRQEDIEQARAQVVQAQGTLRDVQTQIEDTIVRAPFSGIVTKKYADPGDFVTPTTSGSDVSSATSSSILSLASTYQVVANVAETDIAKIRVGQSVTIKADAFKGQTFKGKVAQTAALATVTSNVTSIEVRADILQNSQKLLPGMNVDVEFNVGKLNNALVIPTVALVRQDNGTGVLVLRENGRPRFTPIDPGVTVNNKTEVRSGLQGDEKVVISTPRRSQTGNPSVLPGLGFGGGMGGGRRGGFR
ncbi:MULTISPECIES: efflux RND transporter periplasmic adaptor subunit [Nostocales]|uniref:Efflux RND transporter periplasmic adaptor subunit n=3 Tax=Nostocales TaxID=1161 RepID=A0A0C1QVW3_9CYAN|nr:efflux RND transporter periplasmic adaptor subunit [Tolypothrix bouteillei]KAF3884422.1 efflux RND transporter periplasmic adaptor subunit [Tolypothrix bouteillei VB521301]